ncbi:TPA: hypothetical protein L4559_005204 [Pseudomonas aeruginosa]|nr:hypothetical protein [Pseudomonas aeruginosa]
MFTYKIDPEGHDVDGKLLPAVFLSCGNCSTIHDLADNAKVKETSKSSAHQGGVSRSEQEGISPSGLFEREAIVRELLSSESMSDMTASGVADKLGEFAKYLADKRLSKKVFCEHTRNLFALASELARYASIAATECEQIDTTATGILLEVVTEEGVQSCSSLPDPVKESLDRTCRRLYRWLHTGANEGSTASIQ